MSTNGSDWTSEYFINPDSILFSDWKLRLLRYTFVHPTLVLANAHEKEFTGSYRYSLLDERHEEMFRGEKQELVEPDIKDTERFFKCDYLDYLTGASKLAIKCEIDLSCELHSFSIVAY